MTGFWSGPASSFLLTETSALLERLARAHVSRFQTSRFEQLRAWARSIALLQAALAAYQQAADWQVLLEYELIRLGRRIDAVLVSPRAIFVLEFKEGADGLNNAAREQVEDDALDLRDFHAASWRHPIIPILVATDAVVRPQSLPLLIEGVATVLDASATTLPGLLADLDRALPATNPLEPTAWERAPYRPVPTIIEAARMLYTRHGVADLLAARADAGNLTRTAAAVLAAIDRARTREEHVVVFVTGIPGAGKTLCGLNAVFGDALGQASATVFLTGNPALVHVLREALARDAAGGRRGALRVARQQMEGRIQALPRFRDHYVATGDIPAEHVAVIDEAQRCWSRQHAIHKTRDRQVQLTDSEPGHLLDIMARQPRWAAIICLIGSGQEIHTGEGGLAEWGAALDARPAWYSLSAPDALSAAVPLQRLPALAGLDTDAGLHLDVPIRSIRGPESAPWVDAVLAGDAVAARRIAAGGVPFLVTRDLASLRAGLRALARGSRRAGLVASSGAARLRAEGLGVELPHMDAGAVARWFLDRWPDVRASDALETVATEFSCQGLELDYVGLCWDGDFLPRPGGWVVRNFRGHAWQVARDAAAIAYRINTYRVLLTRARYENILFVPRGAQDDPTRDPRRLDAVAAFLLDCGARPLDPNVPATAIPLPSRSSQH